MSLLALPPNPSGIRTLLQDEATRLKEQHPSLPPTPKQCPTCAGKERFRWLDGDGQVAEYQCDCVGQWVLHRYLLHCGIGKKYQRLSWADVQTVPAPVQVQALEYAERVEDHIDSGYGLILRGETTGTGKTLLAVLLLKKIIAMGYDGYFTQFNDLLDQQSAGWGNSDERAWFIRRIRNAGFLVIDDVGRENPEAGAKALGMIESTFDKVIRARHDDCKPTIITTNKTDNWWRQRYQGNIMSLLSGTSRVVEMTGTDFRQADEERTAEESRLGLRRPLVIG